MDNSNPQTDLHAYDPTSFHFQTPNEDDQLQPTQQQLEDATAKARTYWHCLAEQAILQRRNGISSHHVNLQSMLGRVPALPATPGYTYTYSVNSTKKAMFMEASSTWRVTANDSCGIDGKERTVQADLQIGIQEPTKYRLTGDCFYHWSQDGDRQDTTNYLGLLALGWSYVLSACAVERQGQDGARIVYTDSIATGYRYSAEDKSTATITIDIGKVDEYIARWWAAILAPNQGWKAIVSQQQDEIYQAPWSVSLDETQRIDIKWDQSGSSSETTTDFSTPPSSREALELLAKFSTLYDLGSQFAAALAATLLLPTHNYYKTTAQLPFPTQARGCNGHTPAQQVGQEWVTISEELPFYMALSCNPSVVMSSLCGVFWDIHISCNLVSPWLHPIINEIPNGKGIINVSGRYHEILFFICATRCPPLSALWLGAAISGLVPRVLRSVESGTPDLDHNAFPWTGCPQSFMDVTDSGPYFNHDSSRGDIARADVWQIRYLPPVVDDDLYYESRPFAPWKPVGRTNMQSCELRVLAHRDCQRHDLSYRHWNWKLKEGSTIVDQGFRTTATPDVLLSCNPKPELLTGTVFPTIPLPVDQNASQRASRTILQWATVNGEGVPAEGIYHDKWVQGFLQDEGDESLSDSSSIKAIGTLNVTSHGDNEWKASLGPFKTERNLDDWIEKIRFDV